MANYPCDVLPHVPTGMTVLPPSPLRTQRGYVVLGGEAPRICDDWTITTLAPEPEPEQYNQAIAIIIERLQQLGLEVRYTSRCAMGTALIRFATVTDRDAAIELSPMFIGDTVLRFVAQDQGINRRATLFTHDVWIMLLNLPLEFWDFDCIVKAFAPYGCFLVWNEDLSNRARILVKIRAYNVDTLPMSLVVMKNLTEDGNADSWTCPLVILSRRMLGGVAGDEDPLPPHDGNPHPPPMPNHGGFWHDHVMQEDQGDIQQDMAPNNVAANVAAPAAAMEEDITQQAPVTPPLQPEAFNPPVEDDPINTFKKLIAALVINAGDVIPRLGSGNITGARCNISESSGAAGTIRTCTLQISTLSANGQTQVANNSPPVQITEVISDDDVGD